MWKDKSLGEVVRGIPALVRLMETIEQRAPSIFIRERVNNEIGNHALADLPAPLALHWAFEMIRQCTIPIRTVGDTYYGDFLHEDEEQES